jgi:hypothetical protein
MDSGGLGALPLANAAREIIWREMLEPRDHLSRDGALGGVASLSMADMPVSTTFVRWSKGFPASSERIR